MATFTGSITVTADHDFRTDTLVHISKLVFQTSTSPVLAIFGADQFDGSQISNTWQVTGDTNSDNIEVRMSAAGSFSAAGWTFIKWAPSNRVAITGSIGADTITGSSQNDFIVGGDGADTLNGGNGNDTFKYGAPTHIQSGENVSGGSGQDTIFLAGMGDFNFANTTITSIEALQIRTISADSVSLFGTQIGIGHITSVSGSSFTDILNISGSTVDISAVVFSSWSTADSINIRGASAGVNTLIGSNQKDTIKGFDFDTALHLHSNDTITGGGGADQLSGGGGSDVFRYVAGTDLVTGETISGGDGTDTLQLLNQGSYVFSNIDVSSVENLQFLTSGKTAANFSPDQIGNGAGTILSVSGGAFADIVEVSGFSVNLSSVGFPGWTAGSDLVRIDGTLGDDSLIGSSQDDLFLGGHGGDDITGGAGNDTFIYSAPGDLDPSASVEVILGQGGTDTIELANAGDFDFSGASLSVEDLVFTTDGESAFFKFSQIGGPASITSVTGSSGVNALLVQGSNVDLSALTFLQWTSGADTITVQGTSAVDSLTGSSQDDTFGGLAGGDTMSGLTGNDEYRVDDALDKVVEAQNGGSDRVLASTSYTLQTGQEIETLATTNNGGFSAIDLTGNEFGQTITGN